VAVLREPSRLGEPHRHQRYYGPHITNQLIREALHPYPDDLVIVTKIGCQTRSGWILAPCVIASRVAPSGAEQTCGICPWTNSMCQPS